MGGDKIAKRNKERGEEEQGGNIEEFLYFA